MNYARERAARREQEYYALLGASARLLATFRAVLAHPSLDIAPEERELAEYDADALTAELPLKVRLSVDEETSKRTQEIGAAPF